MTVTVNPTTVLLNTLGRIAVKRQISSELLPPDSIKRIKELAELYTKPSEYSVVFLELPLESPCPIDVQFCETDSLSLPVNSDLDFALHKKVLDYGISAGDDVGIDFALDADCNYASAPCMYSTFSHYKENVVSGFFDAVNLPSLGSLCNKIISGAPEQYDAYYVGLMHSRNPSYARIGFRHSQKESVYKQDISRFITDLKALGYHHAISDQMKRELQEAAEHGFLQDTQLSITPDGKCMNMLAMSSLYPFKCRDFSGLNLLKEDRRQFLSDELKKCCFAVKTWTMDDEGNKIHLIVRGFVQCIKCTWKSGMKQPLKAYYTLMASIS